MLQGEAHAQRQSSAKLLFLIRINQSYAPRAFLVWPSNKIFFFFFGGEGGHAAALVYTKTKKTQTPACRGEGRAPPRALLVCGSSSADSYSALAAAAGQQAQVLAVRSRSWGTSYCIPQAVRMPAQQRRGRQGFDELRGAGEQHGAAVPGGELIARHRSSCSLSSCTPSSAASLSGWGQDTAARLFVSLPSTCSQILLALPFHQQTLVS